MNWRSFLPVGFVLIHAYIASLSMLFCHLMVPMFVPTQTQAHDQQTIVIQTSDERPELVYTQGHHPNYVERLNDARERFLASEYIDVTRYPYPVTQAWCETEALRMTNHPSFVDPHRIEAHRGLHNSQTCEFTTTIFMTRIQ